MSEQLSQGMANPHDLLPNPWNTNVVGPENEAKLEESIRRFGMFKPVVVRTLDNGQLEILGGEHRAAAAKRLGIDSIPIINLGSITEAKAKQIGLVDNGRYGNDDNIQLAELLKELGDIDDLASFMPYSDQDFANIIDSSTIDLDLLADLDDETGSAGTAPADTTISAGVAVKTHTILRFKVSMEDSELINNMLNDVIKAQGFEESDSLTNFGDALVYLLTHKETEVEE